MRGEAGCPVRLRFAKRGRVRFISHRDVARAFERAFRVEQVPLAFTRGFAPRPKVSFGLALPTGYESEAEYLDVELTEVVDLEELRAGASAGLPEGMEVTAAKYLAPRAVSLQQAVGSVEYLVEAVPETAVGPSDVEAWVHEALLAETLPGVLRRKGREVEGDLRPAIRGFEVAGTTSRGVRLKLEVSTQPRSVRPVEVLALLGPGGALGEGTVVRREQWIERDGSRQTPLEADTRPYGFGVFDAQREAAGRARVRAVRGAVAPAGRAPQAPDRRQPSRAGGSPSPG